MNAIMKEMRVCFAHGSNLTAQWILEGFAFAEIARFLKKIAWPTAIFV